MDALKSSSPHPIPEAAADSRPKRRRYISPEAGHALEILGHAIEYLIDEFVHEGGNLCAPSGQLEAVQLLMARNREIYLACPLVPSFVERCRMFLRTHLHPHRAPHHTV